MLLPESEAFPRHSPRRDPESNRRHCTCSQSPPSMFHHLPQEWATDRSSVQGADKHFILALLLPRSYSPSPYPISEQPLPRRCILPFFPHPYLTPKMPSYEVEHVCPLTSGQKDSLAEDITKIHTERFGAPSLFVNVRFTDTRDHVTYAGGVRRNMNKIVATVRHGASRTQADYAAVGEALMQTWEKIVSVPAPGPRSTEDKDADTSLKTVFFLGAIVAGMEQGFVLPPAGEDAEWMRENMHAFRAKADSGDEDMKGLVEEIERRKMV
ncbi:hypothetical protein M8818_001036 [Zalaria obscura]|uniref:Uncharacterized protein n=1 Tax=Zalaria obscura TaxID=2024903 RepID=A0ACC3SQE8_9PEZI